ncbi:MAG: DUF502 domain-containing protein [bacterium]
MKRLRKYLLAGIATVLPLGLSILVIWFLVTRLGHLLSPLLARHVWLVRLPGWVTTIIGFVVLLVFIVAVGTLASSIAGRWFVRQLDRLMRRLPFIRGIYTSTQQLADAVFVKRSSLRQAVIVEYPRRGLLAVGFVTSDERFTLADGRRAVFVYFPTTPNPTSGWLALIPEDELTETGITTDEGLRLVVSGGVVLPEGFAGFVHLARIAPGAEPASAPVRTG